MNLSWKSTRTSVNFQTIVAKMRLPQGLCPGPRRGAYSPPPHTHPSWKRLGHTPRLTTLLKNRSRATDSVDNLFHTLMVLWENENFLTSNLLCFFTSVKLCPLVILLCLISRKNIRINIFITIQYLKHFYLIPP